MGKSVSVPDYEALGLRGLRRDTFRVPSFREQLEAARRELREAETGVPVLIVDEGCRIRRATVGELRDHLEWLESRNPPTE